MPVTASLPNRLRTIGGRPRAADHLWEIAWASVAVLSAVSIVIWPEWETIPFYLIWISLTLLYGFKTWSLRATAVVLAVTVATTTGTLSVAVGSGQMHWLTLTKVPLMAIMFLTMAWHARRRVEAVALIEGQASALHATLERQERFIHDASHELKTPVTIARGHLELARGPGRPEIEIALDELRRIDGILGQLLLLATAGQPGFLHLERVELEPFLEDIFIRWSGVAPRSWRLGIVSNGSVMADPERLRTALDALLENAVKYSEPGSAIELRALWDGWREFVIDVEDEGIGVPREATDRIFMRFGRADAARNRAVGGVGLGLAIVDAIATHHGGRCTVRSASRGSIFSIHLPALAPQRAPVQPEAASFFAAADEQRQLAERGWRSPADGPLSAPPPMLTRLQTEGNHAD